LRDRSFTRALGLYGGYLQAIAIIFVIFLVLQPLWILYCWALILLEHLLQPSWFESTTWIFKGKVAELGTQLQGRAIKSPTAQSKRAKKGHH